jgi:hypothetical protein
LVAFSGEHTKEFFLAFTWDGMGWDGAIVFYYIRRLRGLALISILMDSVLFGIVIIVGLDFPDGESFCTYLKGL